MTDRERDASDAFAEGVSKLLRDIGVAATRAIREAWPEFAPPAPSTEPPAPAEPEQPPRCSGNEGATGVDCQLADGHALPHEGWHRPAGDETGEYAIVVQWPVPDRPDHLGGVPAPMPCHYCGDPVELTRRPLFRDQQFVHYWTGHATCAGNATEATPPDGWRSW